MSDFANRIARLSPKRLAFLAMELQSQLEALQRGRTEPVAVVGIGCRFPGSITEPDEFWRLLHEGRAAIVEVPPDRWNLESYFDADAEAPGKMYSRAGGFLTHVDRFDAPFFSVSPREASSLDPQQRLLLETSWEALEDACQPPDRLHDSRTGVFVGISSGDYAQLQLTSSRPPDAYYGTGVALSVAAGRLAYTFGLHGPCLAVDTACSSSLVAVHLACQSLRQGECNLALAGGVNVILTPETNVFLSRAGMLARDDRCKTFDAGADGYVRGEGCGVVVLKRLSDALAAHDRILALIRGTAINQDGRSSGLTAPNGAAQETVIRDALSQAGVDPRDIAYVEAHGTGTRLGDPIEIHALGAVLGAGRSPASPVLVGSVKTNVGHLEAAAGVAGLIKVVLSLQREEIPPHLNLRTPNPLIRWSSLPVRVTTTAVPWKRGGQPRIAGVSSFGFSGTNAHLIVEEAPAAAAPEVGPDRPRHVLALSAKTETALKEMADRYLRILEDAAPAAVGDVCFTANAGRTHFQHRIAVCGATAIDIRRRLAAFLAGQDSADVRVGQPRAGAAHDVAFLFSGSGSSHIGMARVLYQTLPTFRRTVDRCAELLTASEDTSILDALYPGTAVSTDKAPPQTALFAVEYALAELWRSWGIRPSAVLGDGVGEYVAACVAGVFTLDDALALAAARERLVQTHAGASSAGLASGPMSEADLAAFEAVAATVTYSNPQIDMINMVTGELACGTHSINASSYWRRRECTVAPFEKSWNTLRATGCRMFVEIGPKPDLIEAVQAITDSEDDASLTASLHPAEDDWTALLRALAALYAYGAPIDWAAFDRDYHRSKMRVPTYPFQRQRYWLPGVSVPAAVAAHASDSADVSDSLYELVWEPCLPQGDARALQPQDLGVAQDWVIFADRRGVGLELARKLEEAGAVARVVFPGETHSTRADGAVEVNPVEPEHLGRLFAPKGYTGERSTNVIFLWGLDGSVSNDCSLASLEAAQLIGVQSLLRLVRVLAESRVNSHRLWLGTRGAQPVRGLPPRELAQSPLWGAARVIALEHPDLWARSIDLEPATPDVEATALFGELLRTDAEDQIALRQGTRLVARLARATAEPTAAVRCSDDGTYLITGGLGALGLRVAGWLVSRGARHLVLTSRRLWPDRSLWHTLLPEQQAQVAAVRRLEEAGAVVDVVCADAGDLARMRTVIEAIETEGQRLRGVVHAAGESTYRPISDLNTAAVDRMLSPKVSGAWILHELTQRSDLEFFLLFSSIASIWGSKGLAHYAAANAFLDALAHHRRSIGQTALSINWGPWTGGGMTTPEAGSLLASIGVHSHSPELALEALDRLITGDRAQIVVATVDWSRFTPLYTAKGSRHLLDSIRPNPAIGGTSPEDRGELPNRWREGGPSERHAQLQTWVLEQLGRVLGFDSVPASLPLTDLGVDSMMAVEIRNRIQRALGCTVPIVHFLDGTSAEQLAELLFQEIERELLGTSAPTPGRSEEPRSAPLSSAQSRIWFFEQLNPGTATFNDRIILRLRGSLDVPALRRAVAALVQRHEALRTRILLIDDNPFQLADPTAAGDPLDVVDLSVAPAGSNASAEARRRVDEIVREPIDLLKGPLFRARVIRQSVHEHLFVFALHHIVSDGWSLRLIVRELAALYESEVTGRPCEVPNIQVQFGELARRQQESLTNGAYSDDLLYWKARLAGAPPTTEVPADLARPEILIPQAASESRLLGADLSSGIRELAKARGATLFMALLAAFKTLLCRLTGQQDLVIGFPVSGRTAEAEPLIGCFINQVPLRTDLSGDPSFLDVLARVRETALGAYAHQELPFEKIVEALQPPRDPNRPPFFQILFNMLPAAPARLELPGVRASLEFAEDEWSKFDLTMYVAELDDTLRLHLVYNSGVYTKDTACTIVDGLHHLLRQVVNDPSRGISTYDLLERLEQESLVGAFNQRLEGD